MTAGFTVVEIIRQNRQARRLRGKSDPIDAHQAALAVLSGADTIPKNADGHVESLRMLITERRSAAKAKTQTMNQIHALLVIAPEAARDSYRSLGSAKIVKTLARTRPTGSRFDPDLVTRLALKRLATRYLILQDEIDEIEKQLDPLVRAVNPTLLSLHGVGLVTAATLLIAAGDNPERLATRATFAALAGVAPQPASSGQRTRHRLSRGGSRQANAALHRIVLLRRRHQEPETMAYFARRRAEGLTDRDITRCLKRHVANEVYAALLSHREPRGQRATNRTATSRHPHQRPRRKPRRCVLAASSVRDRHSRRPRARTASHARTDTNRAPRRRLTTKGASTIRDLTPACP